jgi:hypothetical protein
MYKIKDGKEFVETENERLATQEELENFRDKINEFQKSFDIPSFQAFPENVYFTLEDHKKWFFELRNEHVVAWDNFLKKLEQQVIWF